MEPEVEPGNHKSRVHHAVKANQRFDQCNKFFPFRLLKLFFIQLLKQYKEFLHLKSEEQGWNKPLQGKAQRSNLHVPNELRASMKGESLSLFLKLRETISQGLSAALDEIDWLQILAKEDRPKVSSNDGFEQQTLRFLESLKTILSVSRPGGMITSKNTTFKEFSVSQGNKIFQILSALKKKVPLLSLEETTKVAKILKLLKAVIEPFLIYFSF